MAGPPHTLTRCLSMWELARADTPGCARGGALEQAGSALPPTQVTEAVVGHLRLESQMGGHEAAAAADALVLNSYTAMSRLIGCDRAEVAVVENATRAWDMAFYAFDVQLRDSILTARAEYASNVIAFLCARVLPQ